MDLRPQAHEIIRTWLFSTVVRARAEHGVLPWRDVVISGWILDPDRKKMSKSTGNVVTPMDLLERYGSDAVRYWAASGRPGVDLTFDEGQLKVGRRLATKVLNAARFALGLGGSTAADDVTEPLDRALLAELSTVVAVATAAFEEHDYTGALAATEAFFWRFCDDYIELVKERAYGDAAGSASAQETLRRAVDVLVRLFAPFLPFVADEVWSWFGSGSVHRSTWPTAAEFSAVSDLDGGLLAVVSDALGQVRRSKSERKLSLRSEVPLATVTGPAALLDLLARAEGDLRAAGRIGKLEFEVDATADGLTVTAAL
jgi:valyl-tRNA synthetase